MFDPSECFSLGERLIKTWDDDATCRTVIGRAYYACFLHARDAMFGYDGKRLTRRLTKQILGDDKRGTHELVIRALAEHPHLQAGKAKILSDQLGQLKNLRIQADYKRSAKSEDLARLFSDHAVADWRGLARTSMTLASQLLPSLKSQVPPW